MKKIILLTTLLMTLAMPAYAEQLRNNPIYPAYDHDHWVSKGTCLIKNFSAYLSCFDGSNDNDGDGVRDLLGIPLYVAYEMKLHPKSCIKTAGRPSNWITDKQLFTLGIMPNDDSYEFSSAFRKLHPDWYDRGHLCMKMHAERISSDAAWNTHTFYNAVPQLHSFNAGIWLDMEFTTAAWAQHYGSVWIITGPIFYKDKEKSFIGDNGEFKVAVPDALFKIVIKAGKKANKPDVLAFIYPQSDDLYNQKPYQHVRFLTTVDNIEKLTGIYFLEELPEPYQRTVEKKKAKELWDVNEGDYIQACKGNKDLNN